MPKKFSIKVSAESLAAAMLGIQQSDFVASAVEEYVANHADIFDREVERARAALLGGSAARAAYLLRDDD